MYRFYSFIQNECCKCNSKDDIASIRCTVDPAFLCSIQFAFAGSDGLYHSVEFQWWMLKHRQEILLPITKILSLT